MLKKVLCFGFILLITISLSNICYATEILMDLEDTSSAENTLQTVDNTTYSSESDVINTEEDTSTDYEQAATITTTDYEDETELSISNMINIILIVVGVVLVLLGIAIIIKLK